MRNTQYPDVGQTFLSVRRFNDRQERLSYNSGKPRMRGGVKFSNWRVREHLARTCGLEARAPGIYSNSRDINSARLFTPNLMKM